MDYRKIKAIHELPKVPKEKHEWKRPSDWNEITCKIDKNLEQKVHILEETQLGLSLLADN